MPPSRYTLGCHDRCGYGDEPAVLASSNIRAVPLCCLEPDPSRLGLLTLIFACRMSHCFGSQMMGEENMDAPEKPKLLKSKTSRKGIGKSDNLFESSTLHSPKRMDAQIANDKQAAEPTVDLEHLSEQQFLGMLACCRATIIVPLP
ncbi:hypothetical protein NEUTE1DRAFT_108450 [Neurospora tetrasperma FGSC 2508]|uniref:Uncharacterized protein n=1 Tax=Neurospora tetrasperma (strain FGSC 2508 / ATCC MYA-4615 / P0657) TaxID=510951 RepID=F8MHW7_NEUT8|nr:uncharacterized protein NEUTE1DRAFT_108450 [Neurospora tetrasperma FGSC 2508]EGO58876.1 hypothetical protein NEUTE1DRAFT_108450 [Neurospora tetrasperma FGSC 2508]EGZ72976.1 hypothetical protein NEUTE2DRAFT_61199 [Neurospora tetrasperma FGSC 2509]